MMMLIDFFIRTAEAVTTSQSTASTGGALGQILMLLMFVAIFYFMLWRPQRKRTKDHQQMLGNLQKGDEVVTSGGLLGKVSEMQDDFLLLTISDNVEVRFQKQAVSAVLPKGTLKTMLVKTGK